MNVFGRVFVGAMAVSVSGVAMAGCSGMSSSSSAVTAQSPSAKPSPSEPASLPSGPELLKALLPVSALPAGFRDNPSGDRNSAQQLPNDTPRPVPAGKVCDRLGGIGWITAGGIETGAFAQTDYANAVHSEEIGEEADTFTGDDAAKVMRTLWREFGTCAKFTEHADGNRAPITLTRKKLSGTGDEGIEATELSPVYQGGTTIAAIRVGHVIVTAIASSTKSDNGSGAVTYVRKIAARLGQ